MFPRLLRRYLERAAAILAGVLLASGAVRAQGPDVPLAERARGAEQIVVGRVASVTPLWRTNDFGDRLIVSVVSVAVEETLKGASQQTIDVEVEGGTIGTLTLRVSDLDTFAPGERAVFYLEHSRRGVVVPHRRGLGLLKMDAAGRMNGGRVTLDQLRRDVRAAAGRQP